MIAPLKKRTLVVLLVAMCLMGIIVSLVVTNAFTRHDRDGRDHEDLRRFHEYCSLVRTGMSLDASDLESGDPKRQLAAADRFYEFKTYHSVVEIDMCSPLRPDLRQHDACWVRNDYPCLARLARLAMQSIPEWRGDE